MSDNSELSIGSFDSLTQRDGSRVQSSSLDLCLNTLLLFFTCAALALSCHHYFFPSDDTISTVAIIPPPIVTDYYEDEPDPHQEDPEIRQTTSPAEKKPSIVGITEISNFSSSRSKLVFVYRVTFLFLHGKIGTM